MLTLPVLMLLAASAGAADPPGRTVVTPWKNGARAAVSITMDDGYASQWRFMAPLLASRGFGGTFFIVTDWVDRENLWDRWREVAEAGHEIGAHGATHAPLTGMDAQTMKREMEESRLRIRDVLGPDHGRSFAYPQSSASPEMAKAAADAGYEAARMGGVAFAPATPADLRLVPSLHPLSSTPLWEMNSWVDDIRGKGGWLVIGVHGIAEPGREATETQQGWEPVPGERYVALIDHIAAARDDLWVAPFGEVARYIRARAGAGATVRRATGKRIEIAVEGEPGGPALTFETIVPADWAEVTVRAGSQEPAVSVARRLGPSRTVRFEASPPAVVTILPAAKKVGKDSRPGAHGSGAGSVSP